VEDINPNAGGSSDPGGFTALSGYLYFQADNGATGYELWRTDGTTLGTTLVEDINTNAGGSSYPWNFTALGDYLYFSASDDGTSLDLWRVDGSGLTESSSIPGTNAGIGCECNPVLNTLNGRLFIATNSDETGSELAYLDEPTFGLPGTNRDGSVWSMALVLLAAVTAVAGIGLRMRGVRHVAS
jgi:ELWxxDGT repeat protein